MLLQRRGHGKRHVTETAAVYILADPSVCLHMSGQLGALRAGVGTQLAFVGLLTRVRASVHGQVAAVLENLPIR